MYCPACGSANADNARFCEKCGSGLDIAAGQPPAGDPRIRGTASASAAAMRAGSYAIGKNPGIALLLSFLIPGVGQFYNGDSKRGGIMLACYLISWILITVYIGIFAVIAVWIWSMINAYSVASGKTPMA